MEQPSVRIRSRDLHSAMSASYAFLIARLGQARHKRGISPSQGKEDSKRGHKDQPGNETEADEVRERVYQWRQWVQMRPAQVVCNPRNRYEAPKQGPCNLES